MRTAGARLGAVMVALAVAFAFAPLPARADVRDEVAPRPRPGPIARGFEGLAYPVPDQSVPDGLPDGVVVTLENRSGEVVGTDLLPAGEPVQVRTRADDPDQVEIRWGENTTALAPRSSFWVMPSFVELEDVMVEIAGADVPLARSGIIYHNGNAALYDDPATPGYDGTTTQTNRDFLACKRDTWGMGQQTYAVDPIELGVHRRDKALIDKGIRAVDWGVAVPINDEGIHELHRDCDDTTVADYGYTHHTTQWLESMGRAVYLLAASPWAGEYRPKIDAYIDHIEQVATLETRPDNWKFWTDNIEDSYGNDFTHRTFMMAAALGLASTLTDDPKDAGRWSRRATAIARRGIRNQTKSGVYPERGGFDVQYQMYGTWLAEVYLSTLREGVRKRTAAASIDRAVRWMEGRVDEQTGQIEIRGTTRVCVEDVWSRGAPVPSLAVGGTVRAFLYWGLLRSDPELTDLAIRIDAGDKQYGNDCPADYVARPERPAVR